MKPVPRTVVGWVRSAYSAQVLLGAWWPWFKSRRALPLVTAASLALMPSRADASLFGEENITLGAILAQEIAQLAEMVNTVEGIVEQVERLGALVEQSKTLLKQVGSGNLSALLRLQHTASELTATLERDIRYIGYALDRVDRQRDAVYQESLKHEDPSTFHDKALGWNGALMESARVAMRAQTNLAHLEGRTQTLTDILHESRGADGVVGQLQLVVRTLGVLHADLEGVQRSLDTGMRVTASIAATQAATGVMVDRQHALAEEHYTDPGPPVQIPHRLPPFED